MSLSCQTHHVQFTLQLHIRQCLLSISYQMRESNATQPKKNSVNTKNSTPFKLWHSVMSLIQGKVNIKYQNYTKSREGYCCCS